MKWYLTISESSIDRPDHGWRGLLRVALKSAKSATNLIPHLIYDGKPNDFTRELEREGVKIIHHRVSFYNHLVRREISQPGYLPICSGTFLRVEIPLIEQDDDFVFYTDCDVNFLADVDISEIRPETFASAPQANITDYRNDINTGIMVMNIKQLRADLPAFINFITSNIEKGWPGCDQENYRRFYNGNWSQLPLVFNWKPYWGRNDDARIIHWHGPKPNVVREFVRNPTFHTNMSWQELFRRDPSAYMHYLQVWDQSFAHVPCTYHGHIDRLTTKSIGGWILNQDDRNKPVLIDVVIKNKWKKAIECNNQRADLKDLFQTNVGGFAVDLSEVADLVKGDEIAFSAGQNTLKLKFGQEFGLEFELG